MSKVVIISGHPDLEKSFANQQIINELEKLLPQAEIRRLDLLYPDFKIDVTTEQEKLAQADAIILQFPFYWYGFNALLRKWIEDVFVFGFAHGVGGDKLKDRKIILSFTAGASEDLYAYNGAMSYPMADFIPPMKQFVTLCQMQWQEPVISYGMQYIPEVYPLEKLSEIQEKAKNHALEVVLKINKSNT